MPKHRIARGGTRYDAQSSRGWVVVPKPSADNPTPGYVSMHEAQAEAQAAADQRDA